MSELLYLNGEKVELFEKNITRKLRIGDVSEIEKRKSSFSYTVKIPRTSRNTKILEMLGTVGNQSRKPYTNIQCNYIVDEIHLINNGIAIVKGTEEFYNLNLIDGFKSLSELLGDKKINELPLDDFDHFINTQVYVDSFANTEGYIYGIANHGLGVSENIKTEEHAPSIFVHTLHSRIYEALGLNLTGDFFTENENYLNEVMAAGKGYLVEDIPTSSDLKGEADTDTLSDQQTDSQPISISGDFTLTSALGLIGASIVNGEIVFSVAGTYKLSIIVNWTSDNNFLYVRVNKNGSQVDQLFLPDSETAPAIDTFAPTFQVEENDIISLSIVGASESTEDPYSVFYQVHCNTILSLEIGGQLVQAPDYLPDMKQIDLIKDIAKRYGLVVSPVADSGDYKYENIQNILNDRAGAEDWTDKLSGQTNETYDSGYAKINKAIYQYTEDDESKSHDGEMLTDNENAEEEKPMIESVLEIPATSSVVGGETTYMIPIRAIEDLLTVNKVTPAKIMHINRVDTAINVKSFDEVTGIDVTQGIPFLNLDFMGMQYFLDTFYESFKALVNNYKEVDFLINLSVIDIYNLDFFRLKYLKQTGRFYYLNSVTNTPGKLSKATMLEISEFKKPAQETFYKLLETGDKKLLETLDKKILENG